MRESQLGAQALVRRDALIEEQRAAEQLAKREAAAEAARLAREEAAREAAREEAARGVGRGVRQGLGQGVGQAAARGAAHPPLEGAAHQPSSTGRAAGGAAEYRPPGGGGCDDDEVPDDFICPITAELMHDPVLARALTVALPTRLLARRGCTEERRREHLTARLGLSSRRRKGPALLTTAAHTR